MKKLILSLVVLLCTMSLSAQETSMKVKRFQNELKEYIAKEGYRPEIDSDGDLTFKCEGDLFWFEIEERTSDDGFYVRFRCDDMSCHDVNMVAVRKAVTRVCKEYRCGKCYLDSDDTRIIMVIEQYFDKPSEVTRYFNSYLSILQGMNEDLQTYYAEYNE